MNSLKSVIVLFLLILTGCETTRVSDTVKNNDNSNEIISGRYNTFYIQPEWDYVVQTQNGTIILPLKAKESLPGKFKENQIAKERIKEAIEGTIRSKFNSLGLSYSESNYDLHFIYFPFVSTSEERGGRKVKLQLVLAGYDRAEKRQLFHITSEYSVPINMSYEMFADMVRESLDKLNVYKSVQPAAGGDGTR